MAECEFATLTKQCLARRVPDVTTLRREVAAWQAGRNRAKTRISWRFAITAARVKLQRLYPASPAPEQQPVIELEHVPFAPLGVGSAGPGHHAGASNRVVYLQPADKSPA
jgi:hypothetical protein